MAAEDVWEKSCCYRPWKGLFGETPDGYSINQYFAQHPEMVLGEITTESTQYGKQETTVKPIEGADLAQQLKEAVGNIHATITEPEISDDELDVQEEPIPADPSVKNFSFTNVDGQIYYRENSFMNVDKDRLVRFNGFLRCGWQSGLWYFCITVLHGFSICWAVCYWRRRCFRTSCSSRRGWKHFKCWSVDS